MLGCPRWIRGGLTLTEFLVSIAIFGILVAILIPAIQAARESARKTRCQDNLKQTALGLHAFHDASGNLPSPYNGASLDYPITVWDQFHMHSWRAALLPYLEQSALCDSINWDNLATDRVNKSVATAVVSPYICPSGASPAESMGWVFPIEQVATSESQDSRFRVVRSDYDALAGIWGANHIRWGVWGRPTLRVNKFGNAWDLEEDVTRYRSGRFTDVSDGLSNTIMLVERGGRPYHIVDGRRQVTVDNPDADYGGQSGWSASNSLSFRTHSPTAGVNRDNRRGIYADHSGGAFVALADASVTFISESTDGVTLAKMIGPSEGQR